MEEAHLLGIPASATMMYGHVETNHDIAEHFSKIAQLQKRQSALWLLFPGVLNPIIRKCKTREQSHMVAADFNF